MLQLTTILFLISFFVLAIIHIIAIELYLYWHFSWFDMSMHFFGGAVVALGLFTLADLKLYARALLSRRNVLIGVFCIAVIWELFELYAGVPIESDFVIDTGGDLLLGLIGGYVGYSVGKAIITL